MLQFCFGDLGCSGRGRGAPSPWTSSKSPGCSYAGVHTKSLNLAPPLPEFCSTTQHLLGGEGWGGGLTPPTQPPWTPPLSDWANFSPGLGQSKFSLPPSTQVSLGQKNSSAPAAPLTTQGLQGGGHNPPPWRNRNGGVKTAAWRTFMRRRRRPTLHHAVKDKRVIVLGPVKQPEMDFMSHRGITHA